MQHSEEEEEEEEEVLPPPSPSEQLPPLEDKHDDVVTYGILGALALDVLRRK